MVAVSLLKVKKIRWGKLSQITQPHTIQYNSRTWWYKSIQEIVFLLFKWNQLRYLIDWNSTSNKNYVWWNYGSLWAYIYVLGRNKKGWKSWSISRMWERKKRGECLSTPSNLFLRGFGYYLNFSFVPSPPMPFSIFTWGVECDRRGFIYIVISKYFNLLSTTLCIYKSFASVCLRTYIV